VQGSYSNKLWSLLKLEQLILVISEGMFGPFLLAEEEGKEGGKEVLRERIGGSVLLNSFKRMNRFGRLAGIYRRSCGEDGIRHQETWNFGKQIFPCCKLHRLEQKKKRGRGTINLR